jgi:hypothetical protein
MYDLNYFLPGQVWQYDTRPGEENSTLTVLAIDEEEDYAIIHIRLDNINVGKDGCIRHLPFSADTIMDSVTGFVKHLDAVPEFKDGYDQWKKQFQTGRAGYWKIPVKEAVEAIGQVMNKKD